MGETSTAPFKKSGYIFSLILSNSNIQSLIHWFNHSKRPFPWRENQNPYRVWISEIMLQQTVVSAVVKHFETWMIKWKGVAELADASEQDVVRIWEGLGYYSRARNIHKAANMILEQFGGELPKNYKDLILLPGIGDYTASAILSIAYDQPYPAIDANIKRILWRLNAWSDWDTQADKQARMQIRTMMSEASPKLLTEGLMELGQTVCLPRGARCEECPMGAKCKAHQHGLQDDIPPKRRRVVIKKCNFLLLIISDGKLHIYKQKSGILRGLYVMPKIKHEENWKNAVTDYLGKELRVTIDRQYRLSSHMHHYTKYADELVPIVVFIDPESSRKIYNGQFIPLERLHEFPMASVYRKIVNNLIELYPDWNQQAD